MTAAACQLGCRTVDIHDIRLVAEGVDDAVHLLPGVDVEGEAERGNPGFAAGLDGSGPDGYSVFPDNGGDFAEHIYPVIGQDRNGGGEGALSVERPFHSDFPLVFAGGSIDAFRRVDRNAAAAGDIADDFISGNRGAALGKADGNIQVLGAGHDDPVVCAALGQLLLGGDEIAYVLDRDHTLYRKINKDMVELEELTEKYDIEELKEILEDYVKSTDSELGKEILDNFEEYLPDFKKIVPNDYQRMLTAIGKYEEQGIPHDKAVLEAFREVTNS